MSLLHSKKNTQLINCQALFLAAPASGQGKTTVTAALARWAKNQGKKVCIFKTGPDYLDPQILAQASGQPVEPLDMWMAGENDCRQRLYTAAQENDLILIEGAMGLFDGEPSSADLAALFGIPVLIVMDVKGMAQTAGAVVSGLANYRSDFNVMGMIANKCASQRHRELIEQGLPETIPLLATLTRSEDMALPERHLGLVQAHEVSDELEQRFELGAEALAAGGLDQLADKNWLHPVEFSAPEETHAIELLTSALAGLSIGIAKDNAFSFIYDANIQLLKNMGANITFFSPLDDKHLPNVDGLWLPGGYPELYAQRLANNHSLLRDIQNHYHNNKVILAECGGFLYCLETLTDLSEQTFSMLGILSGDGAMRGKRGCQGMQTAPLPEGDVRGHAHHRSRSAGTPEAVAYGRRQRHPAPGEAIFREKNLTASYLHLFFPSNPLAIAKLFNPEFELENNSHVTNVQVSR